MDFSAYFILPENAEVLVNRVNQHTTTLSVQEFVDVLGPHMYWYHFKRITMQQISVACGESREKLPPVFFTPFDNWCRHAFAKVDALGGRFTLSLMAEHRLACKADSEAGLLLSRLRALTF